MSTTDNTQQDFVTLDDIFADMGIEVRSYVNKEELVKNNLPFCITAIELVEVKESKYDIPQQWKLDVIVSLKDEDNTQLPYWLTFIPNEVRNEYLTKMQEGLNKLSENNRIIHNCRLEAIPLSNDRKFYQINKGIVKCSCTKEG